MSGLLENPALTDCRRLFLRNYEIRINIGVHAFEKTAEQRVRRLGDPDAGSNQLLVTQRARRLAIRLGYDPLKRD